jgi:hypothetical protein
MSSAAPTALNFVLDLSQPFGAGLCSAVGPPGLDSMSDFAASVSLNQQIVILGTA